MKQADGDLVEELKKITDRFIEDQEREKPLDKPENIADEIHGNLADLMFIDKVENDTLVGFIIGLFYAESKPSHEQVLQLLRTVRYALNNLQVNE